MKLYIYFLFFILILSLNGFEKKSQHIALNTITIAEEPVLNVKEINKKLKNYHNEDNILKLILEKGTNDSFEGVAEYSNLEDCYYKEYQINLGDENIVTIERTYFEKDNYLEYGIFQKKLKDKFSGIIKEKDVNTINFTLKNSKNNIILEADTDTLWPDKMLYFCDYNKDGYIDIGYLFEENNKQTLYSLYLWNNVKNKFIKQEGIYYEYSDSLEKQPIYGYNIDGSPLYYPVSDDEWISEFINFYFENLKEYINSGNYNSLNDLYLISKTSLNQMKKMGVFIKNKNWEVENLTYSINSFDFNEKTQNYDIKLNLNYKVISGNNIKNFSSLVTIEYDVGRGYYSPIVSFEEKAAVNLNFKE